MKPFLIVLLALAGVFLLCGILFAACIVVTDHGVQFFNSSDWSEKAERTDTRDLNLKSGQTLRVETPEGAIRVHAAASESAPATMRATVRAAGKTQADAQAFLDRATVTVEESARGVAIRLDVRRDPADERNQPQPAADYEIAVPAGVALELVSRSGAVEAEGGPFGPSRLESSYGNVQIDNVRGDVTATSKSGKVEVGHVSKGSIDASSGYGSVTVSDVDAGGSVQVKSSSGHLQLARIHGQRISAESGYGSVEVSDVETGGDVEARSKSGHVTAESVKASRLQLTSGYGALRAKHVQAGMALETSSGSISVDDVQGALDAKTGYGSIDVDGVFSGLALESNSGGVKARARQGSKVDSEWSLASSYGRVELRAPKDLAFDLNAKTGYGQIDCGYAMEVAPGALGKSGREVQSRVNGGGKTVRMSSGSGSVVIAPDKN
jgi:DUF4097 and DUF4098 domain-containing protein YvlB